MNSDIISGSVPNGTGGQSVSCAPAGQCPFLDLPGEILSQIASYLDLDALIPFLYLHPTLLQLTKSHLSPLPFAIRSALSSSPYSSSLAFLPHLYTLLPVSREDQGRLFVPVLVQARPKWLLERFEAARWTESVWKEAFERRYLPSWKRYKGEEDTWRATFLRLLGRLEHRNLGCTHEESWTRFVTLHRNGSASINRIYSRLFDPYEIFDELKHQNNFAAQPTQIRVVVHLQDVRVLAVGVLLDQPSLFVNHNAHLALHPPLLREIEDDEDGVLPPMPINKAKSRHTPPPLSINPQPINGHPQTAAAYGLDVLSIPNAITPTSPTTAGSPSIRTTLAQLMPGRRRSSTAVSSSAPIEEGSSTGHTLTRVISPQLSSSLGRLGLTAVRSRESDDGTGSRRRTWSFGRSGGSNSANQTQSQALQRQHGTASVTSELHTAVSTTTTIETSGQTRLSGESAVSAMSGLSTSGVANANDQFQQAAAGLSVPASPLTQPEIDRPLRPYTPMCKPQPAPSHILYPNFTPRSSSQDETETIVDTSTVSMARTRDLRADHPEAEDEFEGGLWAREDHVNNGDDVWGEGGRMAEWAVDANGRGTRRRWVGPMLIIAQLHPTPRPPHPAGSNPSPTSALEGPHPDLGPKGMYASLGFEDVEALFPWLKLRGSGANSSEAKRGGMGFE